MMTPALRKLTFTTHITSSVGWAGAVLAFLGLAVIGFTSHDELTVRGAYLVMAPAAWFVLVPLAHVSLLSGIALSLGTRWGLFRHYWVLVKLLITVFATVILLMYLETFGEMAGVAADPMADLAMVRNASPILHGILAFLFLLAATVLGVYKPLGMTAYGRRKHEGQRRGVSPNNPESPTSAPAIGTDSTSRWIYLFGVVAIGMVLLFLLLHLTGGVVRH